ncbi:hypothetical protein Aperf_G00000075118 [Anoplocephala perfoliata]
MSSISRTYTEDDAQVGTDYDEPYETSSEEEDHWYYGDPCIPTTTDIEYYPLVGTNISQHYTTPQSLQSSQVYQEPILRPQLSPPYQPRPPPHNTNSSVTPFTQPGYWRHEEPRQYQPSTEMQFYSYMKEKPDQFGPEPPMMEPQMMHQNSNQVTISNFPPPFPPPMYTQLPEQGFEFTGDPAPLYNMQNNAAFPDATTPIYQYRATWSQRLDEPPIYANRGNLPSTPYSQ